MFKIKLVLEEEKRVEIEEVLLGEVLKEGGGDD